LHETNRRRQVKIVAGVTGKTSAQRRRGSSRDKAATHTPVSRCVANSGDLPAQHRVLMAQNQQFGVLAQVSPHQHRSQTQQRTHQPIQHRQQRHPTIIHDREPHERRRSGRCIEFPSPTLSPLFWGLPDLLPYGCGSDNHTQRRRRASCTVPKLNAWPGTRCFSGRARQLVGIR
jgi:hypothetical protein